MTDGVSPILFQTSLFLKRKYDATVGIRPQMNITRAALRPFSTGPEILSVTANNASSRMYQYL